MSTHPDRRRGFALALVLIALVVIGALLAGVFFTATQDYGRGRNSLVETRALSAAEFGQDSVYAGWNKVWNTILPGSTLVMAHAAGDGSVDTVRITRLNYLSFLVVSEGRAGSGGQGARRRTGMLVRLNVPVIKRLGAITTAGNLKISGDLQLYGTDSVMPGWNCPPAGAPVAGVAVSDSKNLQQGGHCPQMSCITGTPQVQVTAEAADSNTYFNYNGLSWNDLVAMADKSVSGTMTGVQPSYSGGACNTSDNDNWGDPNRASPAGACETYFPIIYAPGDLAINGNVGQGMLLVGGNLSIQGNFTFYGEVIVRGTAKLTGTGNHINGGLLAASVIDSTKKTTVGGQSTIQYSSCAANMAVRATAQPLRATRSWAELF